MNAKKYFDKNKKIYGISEFFAFGNYHGYKIEFDNYDDAISWLGRQENDFRTRFLVSKTAFNKCEYEIKELLN